MCKHVSNPASRGGALCYSCKHRRRIPGDCHSACSNPLAQVEGDPGGIRAGYFVWPVNFDPTWLLTCTGYERKAGAA
jgi:hypothetical protein